MSTLRSVLVVVASSIAIVCVASIASQAADDGDDLEKTKMALKKVTAELESTKKMLADLAENAKRALAIRTQEVDDMLKTSRMERNEFLAHQKKTLSILSESLKSPEPLVRLWGAQALAKLGSSAKDHSPDVAKLLMDSDNNVAKAAADALRKIDVEAAKKAGIK